MKAKQTVDPAACDALDHALGDMAKMYIKEWLSRRSSKLWMRSCIWHKKWRGLNNLVV
jgi:hypothetical protein